MLALGMRLSRFSFVALLSAVVPPSTLRRSSRFCVPALVAATRLGYRCGDTTGPLPRPVLGAFTRFASTVAEASIVDETGSFPAAAVVVPSIVLFKVGAGSRWIAFKHKQLLSMNRSHLLKALKADETFAHMFEGIDLSACSIAAVKNSALPAGAEGLSADQEVGDLVVEMMRTKTVGDVAKEACASGAPLFVRVGLPFTTQLRECSPDHPFSELARGMMRAEEVHLPAGADGIAGARSITLPHGVSWPDMHSPVLFVRHFYEDLWEKVLNKCRPQDEFWDAVVIGTPGISKSAFGLYALYRAMKAGRTVIYSAIKGGHAVFNGGRAYHLSTGFHSGYPLDEMSDPDALYISDDLPPVARSRAFRLLVTDPDSKNWGKFEESPCVLELVLPSFTLPEMLQLREVAFSKEPRCSAVEVAERFERWGGCPWSVLTYGGDEAMQKGLFSVAKTLPLTIVDEALNSFRAKGGVDGSCYVQCLVEIVPRGALPNNKLLTDDPRYYRLHHSQLITDHVVGLFADNLLKTNRAKLLRLLHRTVTDPAYATLRGKLYERCIVVPRFAQGPGKGESGKLQLKRLLPSLEQLVQSKWLEAPRLSFRNSLRLVHYRDLTQLASLWEEDAVDAIFVPQSRKEVSGIDCVLRIGGQALLVNATLGKRHAIKLETPAWDTLLQIVGLTDTHLEIPLAWIQDEFTFEESVVASRGDRAAHASHPIGSRLAQYKLLVKIPPATASWKES